MEISVGQIKDISDDKVLMLMTGSQGEPMSALTRIAEGRHRGVTIKKDDTIIGKVVEVLSSGWLIDLGSPYTGFLPIGEAIAEKIDILRNKKVTTLLLVLIMLLAVGLRFYRLGAYGYGNNYYAAAVESMTQSWHNFFYFAAEHG